MNLTRLELAIRDRAEALVRIRQTGKILNNRVADEYALRAAILTDLAECLADYEIRLAKDAEDVDPIDALLRDEVQP
jgi:hypothetical protein